MLSIRVWETIGGYWKQSYTNDKVGTGDELGYFRVIRNGVKEFYYGPTDYKNHMNLKILTNVRGDNI